MLEITKLINQILENLKTTGFSRELKVNEKEGEYYLDCSLFLTLLLQKLDYPALKELESNCSNRLKAKDYFNLFSNLENFGSFKVIRHSSTVIQPGDILIWRKLNPPKHGDTGHIVIVKEILSIEEKHLNLSVYDCTKVAHDNDSRPFGEGIGHGEMKFILNKNEISGYIWSSNNKKNKLTDILLFRLVKIQN